MPSSASNVGDDLSGALTYQVYTPDALPSQRSMPSLASASFQVAPKPSIALRVCLVLVGVCVVVGTAALIIVGASEDAPKASKATAAASAAASAPSVPSSVASAVVDPPVAEPPPVIAAVAPTPPDPPAAPAKPASKAKAKTKAAGSSASGLGGVALPPNPFGGGAAAKPPAKKK